MSWKKHHTALCAGCRDPTKICLSDPTRAGPACLTPSMPAPTFAGRCARAGRSAPGPAQGCSELRATTFAAPIATLPGRLDAQPKAARPTGHPSQAGQ